jgi:competence protein ComEC
MPFSNSYIAILDVGHGNCSVLFERGNSCVIDCGPGSFVLEFLTGEGITHIENVFLSHADQDHIEGLVVLLSSDVITIGNVYVNSDGIKKSELWDDLTYSISKTSVQGGTKLFAAITRSEGEFKCGEITIETIGPTAYLAAKSPGSNDRANRKITSNSISASFRILWAGKPVAYLAGDIDEIALDDLKDHKIEITAPFLVFPHHGGNISGGGVVAFTDELCDLTHCETVIFSIGRNKHSNPRPDVIRTIRTKVKNVRIACTQLSKHCAAALNNTSPVHLNAVFARGRATNACCSGTFMIELTDVVTFSPGFSAHQAFIAAATTSAICIN